MKNTSFLEIENGDKVFDLLSFAINSFLFLLSGALLGMDLLYLILTDIIIIASILFKRGSASFLAFGPFVYLLWKLGTVSSGDIFLFVIGFVCSFIFLFQFSVSSGKETDLVGLYASGIIFSSLFAILAAMKYQLFSSLFTVSSVGIFLVLLIIIFFRIQYYLWKGK